MWRTVINRFKNYCFSIRVARGFHGVGEGEERCDAGKTKEKEAHERGLKKETKLDREASKGEREGR